MASRREEPARWLGDYQRSSLPKDAGPEATVATLDAPLFFANVDQFIEDVDALIADGRASATIIVSTHLTDEAALGDTVLVLHDGKIVFAGTPAALAATAQGRAWVSTDLPPPGTRASWRQVDGSHRCLGTPPLDAQLVEPTVEDGYLLLIA